MGETKHFINNICVKCGCEFRTFIGSKYCDKHRHLRYKERPPKEKRPVGRPRIRTEEEVRDYHREYARKWREKNGAKKRVFKPKKRAITSAIILPAKTAKVVIKTRKASNSYPYRLNAKTTYYFDTEEKRDKFIKMLNNT